MITSSGGGYTGGYKNLYGPSSGLLARSEDAPTTGGIVYVAFNYRLGSFGFLSGKAIEADGTANAALYDQRFALMWVKKYIHLFGGDCERVTLMGESAGGGSVVHQITVSQKEKIFTKQAKLMLYRLSEGRKAKSHFNKQ
jgi:carboxylesterase type B